MTSVLSECKRATPSLPQVLPGEIRVVVKIVGIVPQLRFPDACTQIKTYWVICLSAPDPGPIAIISAQLVPIRFM